MQRIFIVLYRVLYSLVFVATSLYAVGFIGNLIVPKSIDSGVRGTLTKSLLIDGGLLAALMMWHVVIRRPRFTRLWSRFLTGPIEHSTYVLLSCLALLVLFRYWRPIPEIVWNVENTESRSFVWTFFGLGWVTAALGTLVANRRDLVALRPRHLTGPGLIVALWATPRMTLGHALFASVATAWVVLASRARSVAIDGSYVCTNHHVPVSGP